MDESNLVVRAQAFLVQYRGTVARPDIQNVAVALVSEDGGFGAIRHLPPSQVSEKLRERGLLDSALVSMARLIAEEPTTAIDRLVHLRSRLTGAIMVSDAMPTDTGGDPDRTLTSLYRSLVAKKPGRRPGRTRGALLDHAVAVLRRSGAQIRIGEYYGDFLIDALIRPSNKPEVMVHAQSFGMERRDWSRAEYETAHFLWAAQKTRMDSICILEAPVAGDGVAGASYDRVSRWLSDSGIDVVDPTAIPEMADRFRTPEQLPLMMAV